MNDNKALYVISGTTGFVGSSLVRYSVLLKNNIPIIVGRNHDSLKSISPDGFDKIVFINAAGFYVKNHCLSDIGRLISSNILFPMEVIEILTRFGVPVEFYNLSSYLEVSTDPGLYGLSKIALKKTLEVYKKKSISIYNVYMYDTFGPYDKRKKIINMIKNQIERPTEELKITDQYSEIMPIEISEFAGLLDKYISLDLKEESIFANQGEKISIGEVCDIASEINCNNMIKRLGKPQDPNSSCEIFKQPPTWWIPSKSLRESIKDFFLL